MLSSFYDNSFAYRFFYKLRNYAQHVGLPIDRVQFTSQYNNKNGKVNGTLLIEFNRERLLNSFDSWSIVKQDLLSMSEYFSVPPLISEMSHNLKEIFRNVKLAQKEELIQSSDLIIELTKHLRDVNVEVFIAHDFRENENGDYPIFNSTTIPFKTIDYIKSTLH